MLQGPFLTAIDPQAAVPGSRDPLGIQTIWSRLGRHVVGNLTTVSASVRDFTTLLLGYYFVERVADEGGTNQDLAVFLMWEQLAAHVRYRINQDEKIRGIERVKRAASESPTIGLGTDPACQILGNQRTYGLWGLYTGPARDSGLISKGVPARLTPAGRDLVERVYLPIFAANVDQLVDWLIKPRVKLETTGRNRSILESIALIWPRRMGRPEREMYKRHLLCGLEPDLTNGRQATLATAIQKTLEIPGFEWKTPAGVDHWAKICRSLGSVGEETAYWLDRIRIAEGLLIPAAALFNFSMSHEGQTLQAIARAAKDNWGAGLNSISCGSLGEMEPELRDATGDQDTGQRWLQIANALARGSHADAIRLLIDQNASVMKTRAGAGAWIELSKDRLMVRYLDAGVADLPPKATIPGLWWNSYFLDAMWNVASELSR